MNSVPTYDELLYPTIESLRNLGGSANNDEITDEVIKILQIPEELTKVFNDNENERRTSLEYNLAWARTYLKKVDAVENSSRGVWSLTNNGNQLNSETCKDIPKVVGKLKKKSKNLVLNEVENQNTIIQENSIERIDSDFVSDWKEDLLTLLKNIEPSSFERLSQRVLRESGFIKVEVTGKTADGGIDGIGILKVNLVSFKILFQCKRYKESVSSPTVRDFRGAMVGRCDKGLIITTGTFTSEAKKEATRDGAPIIDLIDGDDLCEILKNLRLGIEVEQVESIKINKGVFTSF